MAKGDGNAVPDEKKSLQNIEGKVIFHSEKLGIFVLHYLKFLILIYVIVLVAVYWIKSVMKGKENETEEN